jgi:hypothetical protein
MTSAALLTEKRIAVVTGVRLSLAITCPESGGVSGRRAAEHD